MTPRDSQMMSPTSDLIRKEFDNVYLAQCDHEYQHYDKYPSKMHFKQKYFGDLYFFLYKCSITYELRNTKLEKIYGSTEESENESEDESDDE